MKKRIKKGFTLIELIVVMAIFSILMVAVMALTGPVQRLFQKTALSEKTYSYANNIQLYLQGKLEYVEDLDVCTSDMIDYNVSGDVDDEDIAKLVEDFRYKHFKDTVGYDGSNVKYLKGNIHVLKLCNNPCKDYKGDEVKAGQILHRVYNFDSTKADAKITAASTYTETAELNDAYFNAQDAVYTFNYSLGASNLKVVNLPSASEADLGSIDRNQVYRALDKDIDDTPNGISATGMSMSIVIAKNDTGTIDVPAVGENNAYRAFASPVAVQVANLQLTNLAVRCKHNVNPWGVQRPYMDGGSVKMQTPEQAGDGFRCSATTNPVFDFKNDIYFIFAYTDEIY